jgi:protein-S-isoprenylcysteine O-methyltransferase Ste14
MRMLHQWLVPALWLAWLAYWLIAARGNKPVARTETRTSRLSHYLPLAIGVVLLNLPGGRWLPYSEASFWAGTALVAAGLGFAIWARVHLAGNWSGTITLKQDHTLTRTGPYAWVRHPIYSGLLLAVFGSDVTSGRWIGLLGVLAIALAFLLKIRTEERFLAAEFGQDFARYRAEVPALLPWPRR